MENFQKNIVKAKIVMAMRVCTPGGARVAIGRTMNVLQKVTLKIIIDPDFSGKNVDSILEICYNFYIIMIFCLK